MTDDERLAIGLSSGRPHARRVALRRLGERHDDAAVDLLLRVASNHEDPLRGDAAKELGRVGSSRAVPPLTQVLERLWEKGDEDLGDAIAWALGEIGDPAAIPALEEVLEQRMDDQFFFFTHREALFALADFGRVEPIEAFSPTRAVTATCARKCASSSCHGHGHGRPRSTTADAGTLGSFRLALRGTTYVLYWC